MKTGSKITLLAIVLLVITIGAGVFYVINNLDSIVKNAIEKYGSEATQTAVRVDSVKISLKEGSSVIKGLSIASPSGFEAKHAFRLGEIGNKINIESLGSDVIVIDDITIHAPQVYFEMNQQRQTNLNELKKNLLGTAPVAKSTKKQTTAEKEPRFILKRVHFSEGKIFAKVVPLKDKEYQLKLPEILLRNLGGSKGATAAQLSHEILSVLSDRALAEVKKKGVGAELDKVKAQLKEKIDTEKAKLKDELENKTSSKVDAEKQKAADKLKSLFGK